LSPLHLFQGFGVEIEYMIVDRETLDVRPLSDRVLHAVAGSFESEVERGDLAWSNELVMHVIELKTNGPAPTLDGLDAAFLRGVSEIRGILEPLGATLLPTGMHPWMDPFSESRLWPHEHSPVYDAYDRIFDCRGHGWANLQATHLNLPFANDDEFGRLHAAIRLILPLLPALAASTPFRDGKQDRALDGRLAVYRTNAARVPIISGRVVPEGVYTQGEYEGGLLASLYRAIAPLDQEGVLQHEWLNSRGAIARFDRMAIEIRVLDVQECPLADLSIAAGITAVLRALVEERFGTTSSQRAFHESHLADIYELSVEDGERAVVDDAAFLQAFGFPGTRATLTEVWSHLLEEVGPGPQTTFGAALAHIVSAGPLARRILALTGSDHSRSSLTAVYRELEACLAENRLL
jgi:gamma-glutamyl:cysteine ligase YbdK (ATP-grasp superfamily)